MPMTTVDVADGTKRGSASPVPVDQMKILLVYPPTGQITDYNTPTGLLYIASFLKRAGYRVTFVDCSVEADHEKILMQEAGLPPEN